ncbi:hypothetical protein LRK_10430 [Lacticaseibacillus rhamnosus K32]|uniref:hypothetical protein n=1 Tax=Lacticaseibacillus rhamnosus TaxID=47715 RepID=UPI0004E3A97B|nr:hypothetical protein [Lacticaseibacillus rhamnosus]KFC34359.1 hypothetical protein LRK_10430 [Lacticaseibacillus rhamnosus K32]WHM89988.1 hypothetical protein QJQ50_00985 [Lacticaseibacillus rhamnosus]
MQQGTIGAVFGVILAFAWMRFGFMGMLLVLIFGGLGWLIERYLVPNWATFTSWLTAGKDAFSKGK